jgi:superfamily II DNA or RNA helicase
VPSDSDQSKKIAYLRDRLFVPEEYVTMDMLERFETKLNFGVNKATGEPIIQSLYHYERTQVTRDEAVYAFNRGDMGLIREVFHDFEIQDDRVEVPMRHPLKIQFSQGRTWRPYQPGAVASLLDHDYGLLKAPPRAGKTLMLAAAICAERQKTIVFAHQSDLLEQMLDTFEQYTNLKDLQKKTRERIVGIADEWSDFDELDVVLCTKQTFDRPSNKSHLLLIQKMFGSVWVDEAHWVPGEIYSKTINRFWAKKRQGCTATPKRKDQLDSIMEYVLGPVVYEISPEQTKRVPVQVTTIGTGNSKRIGDFTAYITYLCAEEKRNNVILAWIEKDVRDGHTVIACTDRKEHTYNMVTWLLDRGIKAVAWNGDLKTRESRLRVLNRMRTGECQVMVGMRRMMTGLDIPRASCFHNLTPTANAVSKGEHSGEGGYEQQCTRVLTEFPGKELALIRDYCDFSPTAFGCLAARKKTYTKIGAEILKAKIETEEKEKVPDAGTATATSM